MFPFGPQLGVPRGILALIVLQRIDKWCAYTRIIFSSLYTRFLHGSQGYLDLEVQKGHMLNFKIEQ